MSTCTIIFKGYQALKNKQMVQPTDTYLSFILHSLFFTFLTLSFERQHGVQTGCCRAIVSCRRSQWNLTLDWAEACCQDLNLILSSFFPLKSYKGRALTYSPCQVCIRSNMNSVFIHNKRAVIYFFCFLNQQKRIIMVEDCAPILT